MSLLSWQLKDLASTLSTTRVWEKSGMKAAVGQLYSELRAKGLDYFPHIWISDEWFCPDRIAGIAAPFYLFDERLLRLEKQYVGRVEGANLTDRMKILRHEAGHAIDNAFGLRRCPERRRIFGSSRETYPTSYQPQVFSRQYVRHLGQGYAQSHPDEDFAETFAVWLTPESQWQARYPKGSWVRQKLDYIQDKMATLTHSQLGQEKIKTQTQGLQMFVHKPGPVYHSLATINESLQDYYRRKRRQYRINWPKAVESAMTEVFCPVHERSSRIKACQFIRSRQKQLADEVASGIGQPKYVVNDLANRLVAKVRREKLYLRTPPQRAQAYLKDLMTLQALEFMRTGRHRVVL